MNLWDHQKKAIEKARYWAGGRRHLALFMSPGVGKTATLIQILREDFSRCGTLQSTLIFAPLSVCPQWKSEFAKFSKIPDKHIFVLTGSGKVRALSLSKIIESKHPAIVITNYEAVQMKEFYELLLKWRPSRVVFDESQRLKDSSGARAKLIYPLAHAAERRFLLTGTPITNGLLDIFGQYKAMDPSILGSKFIEFKKTYFYDRNATMPAHVHFPDWQPLPHTEKFLGKIIGDTSVQAKKEDCLDLPELLKIPVKVQLSAEQRRIYESMKKHFLTELNGVVSVAEFAMTKTMRLQQIIAGFVTPEDLDNDIQWVKENSRLKALEDILDSIGDAKVIIWTNFKPTYKLLTKVCEKRGMNSALLTGEQSAAEKQASIDTFCRGATQVLIANPAAGGVGINLVEAKYAIYYSRGYSLEQYEQSEARNYRGGSEQHESIIHYHLIAEDTVDEVIAKALLEKKSVAESVLAWAKSNNA